MFCNAIVADGASWWRLSTSRRWSGGSSRTPVATGEVLGLATEALTKPEESIWLPKKSTPQGPPDELFPGDLDDAGLPVEEDGVEEEPGEPFFDELPVDDWAA
jgi:hypothetical protein